MQEEARGGVGEAVVTMEETEDSVVVEVLVAYFAQDLLLTLLSPLPLVLRPVLTRVIVSVEICTSIGVEFAASQANSAASKRRASSSSLTTYRRREC